MPVANINVLAGHPRPVLARLLRETSAAYAEILESPIDRVQVWITETEPHLYAIGGVPADEVLTEENRASTEIPLIRLVAMDGRPVEQLQRAVAELSAICARVLGTDPERVRVETQWAQAEVWGIGGVPASVKRAAEVAARAGNGSSSGAGGA